MGSRPTRSGKWRCGRDAPLPKGLPSRYALEVKYDRTGRSYWISSDDPTTVDAITYAVYPGRMFFLNMDTRRARKFRYELGGVKYALSLEPCEPRPSAEQGVLPGWRVNPTQTA